MPSKIDKVRLTEKQDRRVKLTSEQKDIIREEYATGLTSLNKLATKYNVSKKTILLIVNPNSKKKNDENIKENWNKYKYSKEYRAKAIRNLRNYKKDLYLKGELQI